MEVIVHVGAPKAGSTALQGALGRDSAALGAAGIFCSPRTGQIARGLSGYFRGDKAQMVPALRRRFGGLKQVREWNGSVWNALEAELRDRRPAVTILSSEHFLLVDEKAGFVERLRQSFDRITMVAYVRDPVSFYVSTADQLIRDGTRLAQLPLPPGILGDTREQIEAFSALLGAGRIVVRNVAAGNLTGGDIALDFYDLVARMTQRDLSGLAAAPRKNESLPAPASVWLLSLNGQLDFRRKFNDPAEIARLEARRDLIRRLQEIPELAAFPKLKMTHPDLRRAIVGASHDYCAWLNRDWLGGQEQMPVEPAPGTPLDPPAFRAALREWLVGQMDPAALPLLMPALLQTAEPKPARKNPPGRRG